MKNILSVILIFLSINIQAQVIPIGTIKKTNKLVTIVNEEINNWQENGWPNFGFKAAIQYNGSKSPIIETGFVAKEGYYGTLPILQNATKFTSGFGNFSSFEGTMGDFPQPTGLTTIYSVRAFAKNSFGQVSYSNEVIININYNHCVNNPCVNGAGCYSGPFGAICQCTIYFCDNCCSQPADPDHCPGGGEYSCNVYIATSLQSLKNNYQNKIIKAKIENNIWHTNSAASLVQRASLILK